MKAELKILDTNTEVSVLCIVSTSKILSPDERIVVLDIRWLTEKTYDDVEKYGKKYLFNFTKYKNSKDRELKIKSSVIQIRLLVVMIELPLPKEAKNAAKGIETKFYPSRFLSILIITVLKTAFGFVNVCISYPNFLNPLFSESIFHSRHNSIGFRFKL